MSTDEEPRPAGGADLPEPPEVAWLAETDDAAADDPLRAALGELNPVPEGADVSGGAAIAEAREIDATVDRAWARVETQVRSGEDETGSDPSSSNPSGSAPPRRRWWELAAAACLGAALVGGSVFATQALSNGGADSGAVASGSSDSAVSSTEPYSGAAVDGSPGVAGMAADSSTSATATDTAIARSASGTVATDDPRAARDSYVATITGFGGRVTSETVTTSGGGSPVEPMPADAAIYPPIYSRAGIFLDMEVPASAYEQAVAAIAPLGEVIEFSQTSYDTGTSITEGEARIAALQASLTRLQSLLSQAGSVTEIIELENAITSRQSELDALTAQQRYLTSQVEQARISLRLVTPAEAQSLDGEPSTWWGKFTAGLADAWMWLGKALAWTSPLWIAALLWWLIRRRRRGTTRDATADSGDGGPQG